MQMDEDIGEARAEIGRLLEELDLQAYVFTLEPKDGLWQLSVECATNGDWQTIALPLEGPRLLPRLRSPTERETLKALLRDRLRECTKTSAG